MTTVDQPKSDTARRKGFQNSLQLLAGVSSWQTWSSVVLIVLPVAAILLLSFPPLSAQSTLLACGFVAGSSILSGVTLRRQQRSLKLLREGLIEQMDSVIKQRAKAEEFYGLATQDALTGLYNRRLGETRLQEEVARAEKSGEPLILLAIDFDKFKQTNDQYGHAAGDLALKEFSRRLQRAVRACDVPVRVGGDEFLLILPDCTLDQIPEIMSRMDSIAFSFDGKKIPVSFSYGAAQYQPNDTPETMTQRADERLYAKKEKRKAAREEEARALVADAGFRRSERVPFEMPVEVHVPQENEKAAFTEAKTLSVNAHGALLAISLPLQMGQALRLVNPRTRQEMECRVCRIVAQRANGANEVGVEFAAVAPTFWDVPSIPADWAPPAPPPGRERPQPGIPPDAAPSGPSHKDAITHLSDDLAAALSGSGSGEWSPPWLSRSVSEQQQVSLSVDDVLSATFPADAAGPVWSDAERVRDVSRLVGIESTWVSQAEHTRPKAASPRQDPAASSAAKSVSELQAVGREIIDEALQNLENSSEDAPLETKTARARASKVLVTALALCVALIILWMVIPRGVSETAAPDAKSSSRSAKPNDEPAALTSSQPSASTAAPTSSTQPLESSSFEPRPCATVEAAGRGFSTEMARVMPRAQGFRLATKEDFDPEAVSELQKNGKEVTSQIPGDFTGSGESRAYLWVSKNKSWYVIIPAGDQARCEVSFQGIAIAARVSKESINRIQWDGPAPPESFGDGLLIVRSTKDPASGVLLSVKGTEIVGSHPADYRQVPLAERK